MPWVYNPPVGTGFHVVQGDLGSFFNAYIAEFRQYLGYDKGLHTSPYVFSDLNSPALQDWVMHFPYQDGLLITYWDSRFDDNNTSVHPGQGLILPIDSHPTPLLREDGVAWAFLTGIRRSQPHRCSTIACSTGARRRQPLV